MQYYYSIPLIMLILLVLYIYNNLRLRKNGNALCLFSKALQDENSGNLHAAIASYSNALDEVNKSRFTDSNLRSRIAAKLKVLRTMIAYEESYLATR
jgi:hypothetical protein